MITKIVKLLLKQGIKDELTLLSAGEPAIALDTKQVYVGTGDENLELAKQTDLTTLATLVDTKVNTNDLTTLLASKVNTNDLTTLLASKVDTTTLNNLLAGKVDTTTLTTQLASKVNTSDLTTLLAGKVDTTTLTTLLADKVDTDDLTTLLASKVNTSDLTTLLAGKVDTTTLTTQLAGKVDTTTLTTLLADKVSTTDLNTLLAQNAKKIGISVMDKQFSVKGDGITDDTEAIAAVHTYANTNNLPVFYPDLTFYLGSPTKTIFIKTNTDFGKAKFIIDESKSTGTARFQAQYTTGQTDILATLDATAKTNMVAKLKKNQYIIPELAAYKNNYIIVKDDNDIIGVREGSNANNGWSKTDCFVVEEGGRIIGDISQDFTNITFLKAQTVEEDWLIIEGGSFYLTGVDNPSIDYNTYTYSGFLVRRCKTIIRNQYVGLLSGNADVSLDSSNGFYNFSSVSDVVLENIHNIPRVYETYNGTPQGTYGIGISTCMNVTFKNVRAEGSEAHWGLFAPNVLKNLRVFDCEINRVDTHFWLWNLHIKDSVIGNKGISITGGGQLLIENTKVHGYRYVDFRRDYGAFWDGDIRIYNGILYPFDNAQDIHFLEYDQADFNHQNNTPIARSIIVRDVTVDFRYMPTAYTGKNILMYLPTFGQKTSGYRTEFPRNLVFENCRVRGTNRKGFSFMYISEPHKMKVYGGGSGSYDATNDIVQTNCSMVFKNIDSYDFGSVNPQETAKDLTTFYLWGYNTTGVPSDGVIPDVLIESCGKIFISLKASIANVIIRNCKVNALDHLEGGDGRAVLTMENCILAPDIVTGQTRCYYVTAKLLNLINCVFDTPKQNGATLISLDHGIVYPNASIRANTVNCRMLNGYINAWETANTAIASAYLDKVANGCLRRTSDGSYRVYP